MKEFLIETHSHTDEVSNCGNTPAAEMVDIYHEMGYDGIVITDHLHAYTFKELLRNNPNASWNEKIDYFLTGYKIALDQAKKYDGFKVYLGAEFRFDDSDNDYLIFGLDEDKLRSMTDIYSKSTSEGFNQLKKFGCTIIQAHPFRNHCSIVKPNLCDGIEVFNGHKGHDSRNDIALAWGKKFQFIMTAGTDYHGEHEPNSGIYLKALPEDDKALQSAILSRHFELKTK